VALFESSGTARQWRGRAGISLLFVALTALMTWPQAKVIVTHASDHQDTYFNLWRLRWIAHALATSPLNLFNGNQFYPESGVLAYSDAMLVEGLFGAPLLWMGLPPVLVHNLVLLGGIVASGVGMFTLARHLSGSTGGGVAAGIVFAFVPYRFDHYMHMELQWTVWMPWAFWALQRTIETGTLKYGALTGVFVALQMMSSIYYGVFLSMLIAVVALLQLLPLRGRELLSRITSLALAAALTIAVSAAYGMPYAKASSRVGTRGVHESTSFSARPRDYKIATETNLIYGSRSRIGMPERRLFPGLLAPLLALIGLLLVPARPAVIAYLIGLAFAFELSLGMYGQVYPFLRERLEVFQGLRASARAGIFTLAFLSVLAAHGFAALTAALKPRVRLACSVIAGGILLLEYWVAPLRLVPFHNTPPPLYAWLSHMPRGVVAQFPMPSAKNLPGLDPRYLYMSTFHWMPMVNGYSGYYPPSYIHRLKPLSKMPEASFVRALIDNDVKYIVIHLDEYSKEEREHILSGLAIERALPHLGNFEDGWGDAAVFAVR
jgi:hypothetical protein